MKPCSLFLLQSSLKLFSAQQLCLLYITAQILVETQVNDDWVFKKK